MIENILEAVANKNTRILIVGSMPGVISLQKQQYYGNTRNHFWRIMAEIVQQAIPEKYEERLTLLQQHQIGLWDVIKSCERQGSLDSAIKKETPNDFPRFFKAFPEIQLVLFNGGKAQQVFNRYFKQSDWPHIHFVKMPSTSPVPGRNVKSFEEKLADWQTTFGR
ncbi:MAG: DNA-deoxyinosine glycosylase [Kurthia sp.]|nr:DNA-deoxyinosine glycosylase [Candidatus Kurthia equi]